MSEPGVVKGEGQVTAQLKLYVDLVGNLEETFANVESRLGNVLQASELTPEPEMEKASLVSLASEIGNTNDRLSLVVKKLSDMCSRLEV
ncbi:hypothetical protein LCGC14_2834600 [marine sediment metagenome]|uniref:Uncharacterized protein n=1 Tax=marine sediment metagenome TaxID=412755 RepID=A0A0F9B423_9ZZZZ